MYIKNLSKKAYCEYKRSFNISINIRVYIF